MGILGKIAHVGVENYYIYFLFVYGSFVLFSQVQRLPDLYGKC